MPKIKITPNTLLNNSKKIWFTCLLMAQICFVTYLALGYGLTGITTGISGWSRLNSTAYVASDPIGNSMYAVHVLLAIVMIIGGSLQLIPAIRAKYTKFHRYNGRVFVMLACTISVAGMYLMIARGTVGNTLMQGLTIFGGCVVILSSILAVRAAKKRNISLHKIWAIRLYLAANGVLFFRLMIFAWFLLFGTLGVDTTTFTGPTVLAVSICSYVIPLLIAELVRHAETTTNKIITIATASLMVLISIIFLVGLFGIGLAEWYPAIVG
ncbi:hypothetical protein AMS58_13735 [Pseudoalteromonas porphyrae]|uniref:DUF2306 domain-containing protein n=1 Tax=Pseudoalteromonas porphyrae TaxID=187330 RepID=UPI0006BACDB2|nr:DUF2306 domain-containing protein [Pseudoalteromonas porphyrae]KPH94176.1 hypothetical protein AMS58_13735 [Pseudoalteromonas porphyrae]